MDFRGYLAACIAAVCLSAPAYADDPDGPRFQKKYESAQPQIHVDLKEKGRPIEFGIALIDTVVNELNLQRYMERREVIRPDPLVAQPDEYRHTMPIPGPNLPHHSAIARNAMKLGAAGMDKALDYVLRRQEVDRTKVDIRVRPVAGGAYLNFKITLP